MVSWKQEPMVSPNQERGRSFGLLHQKRLFQNGQNLSMCLLPLSLKFLCLGMGIILPSEAQLEELLFVRLLLGIQLVIFHQLQMELPNRQLMYGNSASNIVHMHHSSILTLHINKILLSFSIFSTGVSPYHGFKRISEVACRL